MTVAGIIKNGNKVIRYKTASGKVVTWKPKAQDAAGSQPDDNTEDKK